MTAGEYDNSPTVDKISGGDITLSIVNPARWSSRLEKEVVSSILNLADDDLPEGCRQASITMFQDIAAGETGKILSGNVDFVLPDDGSDLTGWQDALLQEISTEIQNTTDNVVAALPHARQTQIIRFDHDFEATLSIIEDVNHFTLTLVTYYSPLDKDALHRPLPTSAYSLMRSYLELYKTVLSGVKTLHGDHTPTSISLMSGGSEPEAEADPSEEPQNNESTVQILTYNEHDPPRLRMNSLGGLNGPKAELKKIIDALGNSEFANFYGLQPTHFLLHGPAGTGKSSLVEAFAEELGAGLKTIASSKVMAKYVGDSGKNIQEIFDDAKESDDLLVLFFDEFDSLAPKGTSSSTERIDVKNIFKSELTELSASYPHIVVAAATNLDPYDFDESIIRAGRLKPIYVGIPTEAERTDIWSVLLLEQMERVGLLHPTRYTDTPTAEGLPQLYVDLDMFTLSRMTDELTGSDIRAIIQLAHSTAFAQAIAIKRTVPITQADMLAAIQQYQKP